MSESSEEDLDDVIAQVESKSRSREEARLAQAATSDTGKSLTEIMGAGGEKSFKIKNKTLKGKKVDVPGQKNKKKIGEDGTLTVGAMGIKIMDGPDVVASYLLQKLASWEASGDTLRIGLDDKNWVEFITDDGSEICEDILTIAKQLVSQKKADEKTRAEQKEAAEAARRQKGIRDFDVTQTFWSKKTKKSTVPETVHLSVGIDGLEVTAEINGIKKKIETIAIQNVVSWETIKDRDTFRLTVKPGALESDLKFAGVIDFGSAAAESIKHDLLEVAQELAKKKKVERAAKKEAEQRAEEEKARLAMKLEDTISDLYLETIGLCKAPDISSDPYAAFDGVATMPEGAENPAPPASWADELKAAVCHDSLLKVLLRVSWTKPPADESAMSPAATMLLTELLVESDKQDEMNIDADIIQAACLALLNVGTSEANRDSIVTEGGVELCVRWLENHVDSLDTCRAVTRVLVQLLNNENASQKLVDDKKTTARSIGTLLKVLTRHCAAGAGSETSAASPSIVSTNPMFSTSVDVLEKALAVISTMLRISSVARIQFCAQGGIENVNTVLGAHSSAQLYAVGITGVLTTLVDVAEGEEADPPAVVSKRIDDMVKARVFLSAFGAFQHRIADLTLATAASLVLRILRSSSKNATVVTDYVFGTDGESEENHTFTMLLNALNSCIDRQVEPIAVGLLIFMIAHLAQNKDLKERIIAKGVLTSIVGLMGAHKTQRTIQESCLIALHMLSTGLPEDVRMMLPGYLGISAEQLEQDEADEGGEAKPIRYEVLRRAALRKEFDLSSAQVGVLEIGEIVESTEQKVNHLGQTRIKTEKGWTSVEARDGGVLLVKKEDDDLDERLQAKSDEIVASLFVPLRTFADDEAVAEACFYAIKSLLVGSNMLKKSVARSGSLDVIGEALSEHADVAGVAAHGCETIGVVVSQCKAVQKALKKTEAIVPAIAKVLEIHAASEPVIASAFRCIEECTVTASSGSKPFLERLASAELDGIYLVDTVLKEHKGANKELLEAGLKIRAKLAKHEEPKEEASKSASTKDVGMGAGRRASLSIFAQPAAAKKSVSKDMGTLEELQEEEEEDDAFDVLNEMMNEMFEVKQNHIKKAPKQVQLQVGSMGLTFYDKDMRPLDNIMYQSLLSWKATTKEVVIQVKLPAGKQGKADADITLKCSAENAQEIVKQMEAQAAKLAAEHRARRKFKVQQTHLKGHPESALLQVQDQGIALMNGKTEEVIEQIPFAQLSNWEVTATGNKQKKLTLFRTGDLPAVELQSAKTSAIVDALELKAGPRVEQESETAEEGVPPELGELDASAAAAAAAAAASVATDVDDDDDDSDTEGNDGGKPDTADTPSNEPEIMPEVILKTEFTVNQSDLRGSSRPVELKVLSTGLKLSEVGAEDSVVYAFRNLRHWAALWGKTLTVRVSAGAGLMTDYTFSTTEASLICHAMERSACEVARATLNSKLPGAAAMAITAAEGLGAAELQAKLVAMQEATQQLQTESGQGDGGGTVNSETLAALQSTQAELRETKTRLETARAALELKEAEMASKAADQNSRIIELEQQLSIQTKAAQEGSKASDSAAEATTKALNDKIAKLEAEMAGWRQKAESAEATASRLKAAAAEGGDGGGGAIIAEITEENEKLKAQVEKLTANGKMAMEKLQDQMKAAKTASGAMEKMKKQREKETAIVKRAMGELQNLRAQVAKKDKEIQASAAKQKKMMAMVATLKQQHATEVEKLKLKAGDGA